MDLTLVGYIYKSLSSFACVYKFIGLKIKEGSSMIWGDLHSAVSTKEPYFCEWIIFFSSTSGNVPDATQRYSQNYWYMMVENGNDKTMHLRIFFDSEVIVVNFVCQPTSIDFGSARPLQSF